MGGVMGVLLGRREGVASQTATYNLFNLLFF